MTTLFKHFLDDHVPLIGGALLVCATSFAFEQLSSLEHAHVHIVSSYCTPGLPSVALGTDLREDELAPYLDKNADVFDFAIVPIDYHVNVRASICQTLTFSASWSVQPNVMVLKEASGVFILALQNPNAVVKWYLATADKPGLRVWYVIEKTAATSLDGCVLRRCKWFAKCNEYHAHWCVLPWHLLGLRLVGNQVMSTSRVRSAPLCWLLNDS